MFAEKAGLNITLSDRPYRSLVTLFDYRDSMAHGRTVTEDIDTGIQIESSISAAIPGAEWQQFATVEKAEELLTDAVSIVHELHAASGYRDDPFVSGGGGLYAISHTED